MLNHKAYYLKYSYFNTYIYIYQTHIYINNNNGGDYMSDIQLQYNLKYNNPNIQGKYNRMVISIMWNGCICKRRGNTIGQYKKREKIKYSFY